MGISETAGAVLKCLNLVKRSLDATDMSRVRWTMRPKQRSGRIRNHLCRPIPSRGELLNGNARNTANEKIAVVVNTFIE